MIPLFHDFEDERVLVAGGGTVGARKARRFAREADVLVCSPSFADADFGAAQQVRVALDEDTVTAWLDRTTPALVVTATDSESINDALATAARERGILVNRADRAGGRDAHSVVVPATVREDPVVAALSTGGHSPALSRHLRERIEPELANAGAMAELSGSIRADLKSRDVPPSTRREAVRAVVRSDAVWTALDSGSSKASTTAAEVIDAVIGETT